MTLNCFKAKLAKERASREASMAEIIKKGEAHREMVARWNATDKPRTVSDALDRLYGDFVKYKDSIIRDEISKDGLMCSINDYYFINNEPLLLQVCEFEPSVLECGDPIKNICEYLRKRLKYHFENGLH